MPTILAIESTCDDTCASVVRDRDILSNVKISQIQEHSPYLGVVPEIAARSHMYYIDNVVKKALDEININDITAIAATGGPGLIGGVIVGVMYAKGLALKHNKAFIPINHLEGHALTARLTNDVQYPYLLLLISGGHCQFLLIHEYGRYDLLGATKDDSPGEAFDKVAKMLELGFPGGPILEQFAKNGNKNKFDLPLSMTKYEGCDMSFSGIKTAVRNIILDNNKITEEFKQDLAASFEYTIAKTLKLRSQNAITMALKTTNIKSFVISGGVASNLTIRSQLKELCDHNNLSFVAPRIDLCTDNAAMIAYAAVEKIMHNGKIESQLNFEPVSKWTIYKK